MQPSAIIIARAEHRSAPSAILVAMSKPVTILPLATILTRSRRQKPTRQLCTNTRPSTSGMPTQFENSIGAAPVPPSGLPPDSSRSSHTKSTSSRGVWKALWASGEITSRPMGTPRMRAISAVSLAAGRMPP